METYSRRRLLTGLGSVAVTASCCSGLKTLFATHKDLFGNYPLALDISLQSSFEGRITGLYSTTYELEKRVKEYDAVAAFFEQTITALTEQNGKETERMHIQHMEMVYHTWLRDLFLFSEQALLLSPRIFSDARGPLNGNLFHRVKQIEDAAAFLSKKERINLAVAPCPFEGGQILKAGEHTLLPEFWNDIRNLEVLALLQPEMYERIHTEEDILHFYEQVFGPTLFVPNYCKTFATFSGHLDMYITPVSKESIFVGDISLADTLLYSEKDATIREYEALIAEKARAYPSKQGPVTLRNIPQEIKIPFQDVLDAAAQYLSQFYTVKRIPFGIIQINYDQVAFLSYNNALIERGTKKALVPNFGLASHDREVTSAFVSEGYTVKGIDTKEGIFRKSGPHCMYLERRKL